MGDSGHNYCHHEKKADCRERGEGPERSHVIRWVRGPGASRPPNKGSGRVQWGRVKPAAVERAGGARRLRAGSGM